MTRARRNFGKGGADQDLARGFDDAWFVETRSAKRYLADEDDCPFVSGAKGVGKSLLLFKRRMKMQQQSGTLVLPFAPMRAFVPSQTFADLVSVAHYWQLWGDDGPRLPAWTALWEWALVRTVVSGWRAHASRHDGERQLELLGQLAHRCGEDLSDEEVDPFVALQDVLEQIDGGQRTSNNHLKLPSSREYKRFLAKNAGAFPQTFVFIDNQDDFFEKNSEFWIASATGSFLAARHLRDVSNNRIHFAIAVRPEVVWRLQAGESFSVFKGEIHHIEWTSKELLELFDRRIRTLQPEMLKSPERLQREPLTALLGVGMERTLGGPPMIRNRRAETPGDHVYERATEIILRNTMRRPRDMIVMGNSLLEQLWSPRSDAGQWSRVSYGIEAGRKVIANAYLAEVRARWPWSGEGNAGIDSLLACVPRNILMREEIRDVEARFFRETGVEGHGRRPFEVLASLGLLGYVAESASGPEQCFALAGETTIESLPKSDWYLLNPILYGDPFDIEIVPGQSLIVGHGLPFDEFLAEARIRRPTVPPGPAPESVVKPPVKSIPPVPLPPDHSLDERNTLFDSQMSEPKDGRCKVLFLSSNPKAFARAGASGDIRLGQEVRDINRFLGQGDRVLELISEWAVGVEDLIRANLQHKPRIVHFSGHGETNGIYVEDPAGAAVLVSAEALRRLFSSLPRVQLVVLNGCSTSDQARAVSEVVPIVVGTDDAISDAAARAFAEAFYGALGFGEPVGKAFMLATACVEAKAPGYARYFRIHRREGGDDPDALRFIRSRR